MGDPVLRWQMVSTDPEATAKFYARLFGWKVTTANALGYRVVDTRSESGIGGGIWPASSGARGLVQIFVAVEDVDKHVQAAAGLGATVIVPTTRLPDGDTMAVLLDPAGLSFGIYERRATEGTANA